MASHSGVGRAELEWLLACWEWAVDVGEASGCAIQVSLNPTRRRGVWSVRVRALEMADGRACGIRAQKAGEWPCADRVEFIAYIHLLLLALDAELANDPLVRDRLQM